MADEDYRRRLNMLRIQQEAQNQQLFGGALGSLAGMVASPLIGAGAKALGIGLSPMEQIFRGENLSELLSSEEKKNLIKGMFSSY